MRTPNPTTSVATVAFCSLLLGAGCDGPSDEQPLKVSGDPVNALRLDHQSEVHLEGRNFEPIRLAMDVNSKTNAHDVSYNTNLDVGTKSALTVYPATGAPVVFDTHPVSAQYFHASKLLIVQAGDGDAKTFTYFAEPSRWESRPIEEKSSAG